jgi:hypothetical protein
MLTMTLLDGIATVIDRQRGEVHEGNTVRDPAAAVPAPLPWL